MILFFILSSYSLYQKNLVFYILNIKISTFFGEFCSPGVEGDRVVPFPSAVVRIGDSPNRGPTMDGTPPPAKRICCCRPKNACSSSAKISVSRLIAYATKNEILRKQLRKQTIQILFVLWVEQ